MVTMSGRPIFIDTNVLIYANVDEAPLHTLAVKTLTSLRDTGVELWTSRQVLREYLAVLTRPGAFASPPPSDALAGNVEVFQRLFRIAQDGPEVTRHLLSLLRSIPMGGKQIHDANIVATMLAHGIGQLLTHNTDDFTRYAGIVTVRPLQ
jgi:predicted nucleic acid-binding protein